MKEGFACPTVFQNTTKTFKMRKKLTRQREMLTMRGPEQFGVDTMDTTYFGLNVWVIKILRLTSGQLHVVFQSKCKVYSQEMMN